MKTQNLLPQGKQILFQDMEHLSQALDDLHCEKNWMFPERVEKSRGCLECFQNKLAYSVRAEERVIFPFLDKHIPRLSPLLATLRQEHSDLSLSVQALREYLTRLKETPEHHWMEALFEQSLYLNFLMRTHLLAERMGIYRVADKELHWEEKQLLESILRGENQKMDGALTSANSPGVASTP